jgi:CBS domain-containing protein
MRVLIEHILRRKGVEVVTITADQPVAAAVATLRQHNIGAIVVTDDAGAIEGIISERDVVRALADEGPVTVDGTVRELMSSDVTTCGPRATVHELMKLMTERRIRHIPVVGDEGIAGIVSIGDVVKSRIEELEDEAETLHDYLSSGRG